jgi:hypothetical protein
MFAIRVLLLALAALSATPASASGVISGYGGTAQCFVLVDSVLGTPSCVYRASVACVIGNVGYVGGVASYTGPLTFPLAIQLYQRPSQVPSGMLTVGAIPSIAGSPVQVALNGTVSTWVLSAPMWGATCTEPTTLPLIDQRALARFCRENPSVPACRG